MLKHLAGKAVVTAVICTFVLLWWYEPWNYFRSAPSPEVVIDQNLKNCLKAHIWDDSYSFQDEILVAKSAVNMARDTGRSLCDVYQDKLNMRAGGEWWIVRRDQNKVIKGAEVLFSAEEALARAELLAEKVLKKDPSAWVLTDKDNPSKSIDFSKFGWFECINKYIRSGNVFWRGTLTEKMRRENDFKYKSDSGSEYFCPKKTSFLQTAPPGFLPGGFVFHQTES